MASNKSGGKLASTCNISGSLLSRIERGIVSPSVDTLNRIAVGLGVPVSRFFGDQHVRSDLSCVKAGQGIVVDRVGAASGYRYELLGHVLSGNLFVEPYRVELLPEAMPYTGFQHPGMKFVQMYSGRVQYRYGSKVVDLGPGDSLLFEASAMHGIQEILERPVSYLVTVSTMRE